MEGITQASKAISWKQQQYKTVQRLLSEIDVFLSGRRTRAFVKKEVMWLKFMSYYYL
jgi:hypothetical protein